MIPMRKAILTMLLAVVSISAAAEWVTVGSNSTTTTYADPATIRKVGNIVDMWTLLDFKTALKDPEGGKSFLSMKMHSGYDCKEDRKRRLYFTWHSENMGGGDVVHIGDNPGKWTPVPPESFDENLWKFACGKR
jgi:hypothetical protein